MANAGASRLNHRPVAAAAGAVLMRVVRSAIYATSRRWRPQTDMVADSIGSGTR
jgi:hypothetical protein